VPPDVAADRASKILDTLHAPDQSASGNERDTAVTHAVFAASDSGERFTVEQATADGETTVTHAKGGGSRGPAVKVTVPD